MAVLLQAACEMDVSAASRTVSKRALRTGDRIIENDHDAVGEEPFQCAFISEGELSYALVIFPQDRHDIFGFGRLGEGAESVQFAEQRRHLPSVVLQKRFGRIRGSNYLRHLRGQKSLQTADPLDLRELLGHPLFEQSVPARGLLCL